MQSSSPILSKNMPSLAIGRQDILFAGGGAQRGSSSVVLTGFGSAYHWNPNDRTLLWDRLPIALSFMAILAIIIEERVNTRAGALLLWPLLTHAVFSLLLWRWTDDMRLYAWVQFFPFLAMLLMFLACSPKYTGTYYWIVAAVVYAIAKVF